MSKSHRRQHCGRNRSLLQPQQRSNEHTKPDLQIAYLATSSLTPHPRNSRVHTPKQIEQIATSIEQFGFNTPILVDKDNQILAGHGRHLGALKLGLAHVPVVRLEHLTEAQRRAFMIADNKLGDLSDFDEEMLALELEELLQLDDVIEITATGFEMAEVDTLVEELHRPEPEADPADLPVDPAAVEKIARLGDLFICGPHSLFVGDALDPFSYPALLGGEKAEMIFIDPPFNCKINGHVSGKGKNRHSEFVMASGEMSDREFVHFLRTAFQRLIENSVDGSIHYVCIDWRQIKSMLIAGEVYTELKNIVCWVKSQGGMGSLYRSQHEFVVVFKSGTARHINNVALGRNGRNRTNVWSVPGLNSFQKGRDEKLGWHPTVKPVGLIADCMLDCSTRGGLILDVFGGSASTMIAAHRCGRRAAVMELDPHYADVSLRRFCDVTGIEPVNAWTGEVVRRRKGDAA